MASPAETCRIQIHVAETAGVAREREPVRIGVPLPRGWLTSADRATLRDESGMQLPAQFKALNSWSDRSIKWLLVDAVVSAGAHQRLTVFLEPSAQSAEPMPTTLHAQDLEDRVEVDTGVARFTLPKRGSELVSSVCLGAREMLGAGGLGIRATGSRSEVWPQVIQKTFIEEAGLVRASVVCETVVGAMRLKHRLVFRADSSELVIESEVWNPRAAIHAGGLWDLGDPASIYFKDLSLVAKPAGPARRLKWRMQGEDWTAGDAAAWSIYQDSSGGERWNSPNHVDHRSRPTVRFKGFRVFGRQQEVIREGGRATPEVVLESGNGWLGLTTENFWQNFPKALRWDGSYLSAGLFPAECLCGFELQGGEKKRHVVAFAFGDDNRQPTFEHLHAPLEVTLNPEQVAQSGAIANFIPQREDANTAYVEYMSSVLEGPHSVVAKREVIDEYGWRNFGDLYADHEAVNHQGSEPFISHYNNQYDFVFAGGLNFLRSADARWRALMVDAARHHIDIDIYHTTDDKPAFSGGLFWHTDHYKPAATCTHRTYSKSNAQGGSYGGGPSCEHDYSSGLTLYYFLTGDPEARAAVVELAEWVLRMDDGSLTLWSIFDSGPTGLATATVEADFQKPGRGAGNSINTLLDAYSLTSRREYLSKAEEFVRRCIHPHDDIAALKLAEPEFRWSYLVFLQVLAKYLDRKRELGEYDFMFHYARESLLHYARWMADNEQPYKDVLDRVLLPTETWPAQDIRKCHVLQVASLYAPVQERDALRAKAAHFFARCLPDLLSFKTAYLTRPQVLLSVYAGQCAGALAAQAHDVPPHSHFFGEPQAFITQRRRMPSVFKARLRASAGDFRRLLTDFLRRKFSRS